MTGAGATIDAYCTIKLPFLHCIASIGATSEGLKSHVATIPVRDQPTEPPLTNGQTQWCASYEISQYPRVLLTMR